MFRAVTLAAAAALAASTPAAAYWVAVEQQEPQPQQRAAATPEEFLASLFGGEQPAAAAAQQPVRRPRAADVEPAQPFFGLQAAGDDEAAADGFPASVVGDMFRLFRAFDDDEPLFGGRREAEPQQLFAPFARLSQHLLQRDEQPEPQHQQLQHQQHHAKSEGEQLLDSVMHLVQSLADGGEQGFRRPAFAPMPQMFVRVVTTAPEDEEEEELEGREGDEPAQQPCPFVVACQSDVLTLCRGAVAAEEDGAVARCLVSNFPLLSERCSDFVQARVAADEADADEEAEDGDDPLDDGMTAPPMVDDLDDLDDDTLEGEAPPMDEEDLDGMSARLLSCERDAETLCVEAVMEAEADPLAIQRCLVDSRDRLSAECRLLVDYMLGEADEGAAEAERAAADAPVPADDAEAAADAADAAAAAETGGVSPRQAAAERRCGEDARRLCGDASGRLETLACLHRRAEQLGEECIAVLDALPAYHCAEDADRLCHKSGSRIGLIKCLRAHADEVGAECRSSLKQHRQLRQDGAAAAPSAGISEKVEHLRRRVAREAGRRMEDARLNPAPALAGVAALSALAAALVVYARRRTAEKRRVSRKNRDAGASGDAELGSPASSSLSAGEARARPGVLMAFRPSPAEQL